MLIPPILLNPYFQSLAHFLEKVSASIVCRGRSFFLVKLTHPQAWDGSIWNFQLQLPIFSEERVVSLSRVELLKILNKNIQLKFNRVDYYFLLSELLWVRSNPKIR